MNIWKTKNDCTELRGLDISEELGNILKALDYDLSMLVRTQKARGLAARAVNDAKDIEEFVGLDTWREVVFEIHAGLSVHS